MNRTQKLHVKIKKNTQDKDVGNWFKKCELVHENGIIGNDYIGYIDNPDVEDFALDEAKKGNVELKNKFPKRWIVINGELIVITKDNFKDYDVKDMLRQIPEEFLPEPPEEI